MFYNYYIRQGVASLTKMTLDGTDVDKKPKQIGKFKTESEAKQACKEHFEKACKMAVAAGRVLPTIQFV